MPKQRRYSNALEILRRLHPASSEHQRERKVRGHSQSVIQQVFSKISRCRIALETGTHSPWLSQLLTQLGHEVIVAHARNVQLITESTRKDYRLDARTLARLARIDPKLLGPVRHRSAKAQIHLTAIPRSMNREIAKGLSPELRDVLEPLLREVALLKQVKGVGTLIGSAHVRRW
jgi:transposase